MLRRAVLLVALTFCACPPVVMTPPDAGLPWAPGTSIPLAKTPNARGFIELRGLVHVHSFYSHDACDGAPHDSNGVYNQPCLEDFRRGACATGDDFFFLTDHGDSFASNEFPQVLLYDVSKGDTLVTRNGAPVANRLACPNGASALIMAGTETGGMPVGLEHHVGDAGQRDYGPLDDAKFDSYRAAGGVTLVAHTEDWTVDQLVSMHLDGFEMFNLHRNALKNGGLAADLVLNYVDKGLLDGFPHPDLFLTAFDLDDALYLNAWGTVLSRGVKRVTTMGSDCHQNTFPQKLQDGERIDSYRRMMSAFSNHLLVTPKRDGTWDDADLKAALRGGRNFGVFEFMGFPEGFDFYAEEAGGAVKEIGETARLSSSVSLNVAVPKVKGVTSDSNAPTITAVLYRARDGGWDELARTTEATLRFAPAAPGAYRVEVRIVPRHLRPWAGAKMGWLGAERPWVMSSALYVE